MSQASAAHKHDRQPGKEAGSFALAHVPVTAAPRDHLLALHDAAGNQAVGSMIRPGFDTTQGLDGAWRSLVEVPSATDLSQVSVHTGPAADQVARQLDAYAATVESDIYLANDVPGLNSPLGQAMLGHELAHVAQQARPGAPAATKQLESEASLVGLQTAKGQTAAPTLSAPVGAPQALSRKARNGLIGAGIGLLGGLLLGGAALGIAALAGAALGGGAIAGALLGGAALGGLIGGLIGTGQKEEESDARPVTRDQVEVARARQRLEVLYGYLDIHQGAMARATRRQFQRRQLAERRAALDATMFMGEFREPVEKENIKTLNQRPLRVEVTGDVVRFHVRFHVRFEGMNKQQAQAAFPRVERSMRAGIEESWNQKIGGIPVEAQRLEVLPEFTLVEANAARDPDFWLISVRPSDTAPAVFQGQPLSDQPLPSGAPTSVTSTTVGSGIISIPPSHIDKPDVLGHELLHLFGLVDRYELLEHISPTGQRRVETESARETGGRPDPLGSDTGPILEEDISFLFEEFDVYQAENDREIREAQRQTEGMSYAQIIANIHRLEEIVGLGRDPESLIPIRKDFTDKMIQSAEDL